MIVTAVWQDIFFRDKQEEKIMALYTETVMDHFTNPRNMGEIKDFDGVGEVGNAKCGV